MIRASWNGTVIAESDRTQLVEGNHYFPIEDVDARFLTDSPTRTHCPWKGTASYFNVVVDANTNADAAWTYPDPSLRASDIKGHVAFWHGVEVRQVDDPIGSSVQQR